MAADKKQARRIAGFVKPLRVPPGTKVTLADDFDPGYRAEFVDKEDGVELLAEAVELLADYQARLAAQGTYGLLVVLQSLDAGWQGRDDPPRHERRQPAGRPGHELQGSLD